MTTRPGGAVRARLATCSKSCSHWLVSTTATKASGRMDGSEGSCIGGALEGRASSPLLPPLASSPRRPPASPPRALSRLHGLRLPTDWFSLSYFSPASDPLARPVAPPLTPPLARRAGAKWASARALVRARVRVRGRGWARVRVRVRVRVRIRVRVRVRVRVRARAPRES